MCRMLPAYHVPISRRTHKEVKAMPQARDGATSPALQILGATRSLRRTVLDMTKSSDIKNITVNFGSGDRAPATGDGDGGTPPLPKTASIIITIEADTAAHAELHAAELEAQGATCSSSGATSVTCEYEDESHEE